MRLFRLFTILCLFWGQSVLALCDQDSFLNRLDAAQLTQITESAAAMPYGKGILWRARRGEDTITVVGTMHIYDPRLAAIFARVQDTVAEADILLVEATAKEEAEIQATMANNPELAFITEGPTLIDKLDPDLWQAVADAASARQVPPFMAAKMQPWFLSLTLAIPPCAMSSLTQGKKGLDHMIMAEAETAGVPMRALEPSNTLLDIMRDGTFDEQVEALQLSLLAPDMHSEMFVAMLDAYFAEEIAILWEASRMATAFVPGLDQQTAQAQFDQTEHALLSERNLNWMPVIAENLRPNTVVAVGAAHLMGEMGILRLLENDGWVITPF